MKTAHYCPIMSLISTMNIINDTCSHLLQSDLIESIAFKRFIQMKPFNNLISFIWKLNIWSNYVQGYLHFEMKRYELNQDERWQQDGKEVEIQIETVH